MDTNIKGAYIRSLNLGSCAALMLLTAGWLQADTLWNNGPNNIPTNSLTTQPCDTTCAGNAYTIFDNFKVTGSSPWQMTGFDFTDWLLSPNGSAPSPAGSQTVTWSIWTSQPGVGNLYAHGTATANLSPGGFACLGGVTTCTELFTVTGLNVTLSAGQTYYIGTNLTPPTTGGYTTYRATSNGNISTPLLGWLQAQGNSFNGSSWGGNTPNSLAGNAVGQNGTVGFVNSNDSMFDITGSINTPEPDTLTLMSMALAGLCFLRRRAA